MVLTGGAARGQSEEEVGAGEFGEFDAAHTQAGAPVIFGNTLHAGQRGDVPPGFRNVGGGTAAGFEARIEIAVIAGLDALQYVVVCIREEFEAGRLRIETEEAQRGRTLLACGEVEREAFDGDAAFAGAEIG